MTEFNSGAYQLYLNDTLVRQGTTENVGITLQDTIYLNNASLNEDDLITMYLSGFSYDIDTGVSLDYSSQKTLITFGGYDVFYSDIKEFYVSVSGTMTRTSENKVTFEGKCIELSHPMDTVSFKGFYKSEAFTLIAK